MKALNKGTAPKTQRPERIIQFGECLDVLHGQRY